MNDIERVCKMEFKDRLKEFRQSLGIERKKDMASLLNISESFYNMIENGTRPVSKNVLSRLVVVSKKPEEYWRYGITDEKEYINKREEFKCLKDAVEQLDKIGLLRLDKDFSDTVKEVILAAALADITHILEKKKQK